MLSSLGSVISGSLTQLRPPVTGSSVPDPWTISFIAPGPDLWRSCWAEYSAVAALARKTRSSANSPSLRAESRGPLWAVCCPFPVSSVHLFLHWDPESICIGHGPHYVQSNNGPGCLRLGDNGRCTSHFLVAMLTQAVNSHVSDAEPKFPNILFLPLSHVSEPKCLRMLKKKSLYVLLWWHFTPLLFPDEDGRPKISAVEKAQLKSEFLHTMQQRFLAGDDEDFDYQWVLLSCTLFHVRGSLHAYFCLHLYDLLSWFAFLGLLFSLAEMWMGMLNMIH